MKTFSLIIILICIALISQAQYTTPGTGINWNLQELAANSNGALVNVELSNYVMHQDITISSNDTITIQSSAQIQIENDLLITVKGSLLSIPDYQSIVAFLGNVDSKGNFKGIKFDNSPGSKLYRTHLLFGGGISLVNSYVEFMYCSIVSMNQALCSGAITVFQSNPLIEECEFTNNAGPAIMSSANASSSPAIINNFIQDNVVSNVNMPQINLGTSGIDTLVISGNTIIGQYPMAGGIALSTLTGGEVKCRVENNTVSNNRYGIAFIGSNITGIVKGNVVYDNDIQGEPMQGGSGFNFYGGVTNALKVSMNTIYNNLWGITIQLNAKPNLGNLDPFDFNIGENYIHDNGNLGVTYDLYNNTPNMIMAENNDWGTIIADSVEAHIFHQPDNPALGLVDYLPFFDPTGINDTEKNVNMVNLDIFPNPAQKDASAYIRITNLPLSYQGHNVLTIIDFQGKVILKINIEVNSDPIKIPVETLQPGPYLVSLTNSLGSVARKLWVVF